MTLYTAYQKKSQMTIIGNHAGSQALEVRHCLFVDVLLWQLFPDGLQGDFQLVNRHFSRMTSYAVSNFQ